MADIIILLVIVIIGIVTFIPICLFAIMLYNEWRDKR